MSNFEEVSLVSSNPVDCLKLFDQAVKILEEAECSSAVRLELKDKNNKSLAVYPILNEVTWGDIDADELDRYYVENISRESIEKLVVAFSEGDEETLRLFENWDNDPTRKRF